MTKRPRNAKRTRTQKHLPPPGAQIDAAGVVKVVLHGHEPEPRVLEHPGVPGQPHVTDDQGVVRAAADDPIGALSAMLRDAGARVTLDGRANVTHPCWQCGTTERPRGLEVVGRYSRFVGGNLEPGDAIRRPLCGACNEATQAGQGGDLQLLEALAELKEERALREKLSDICTRTVDALRGPHPTGGLWGWHDLPKLAAAARAAAAAPAAAPAPFDLEMLSEAFEQVVDAKLGNVDVMVENEFGVRHKTGNPIYAVTRAARVTSTKDLLEKVFRVYEAWRAAKR